MYLRQVIIKIRFYQNFTSLQTTENLFVKKQIIPIFYSECQEIIDSLSINSRLFSSDLKSFIIADLLILVIAAGDLSRRRLAPNALT